MNWREVTDWCHQGEGDRFGLCFFAMCGNHRVLLGGDTMPIGEIENAAREIEGFNPYVAATDRGENLEVGFKYIQEKGWPGDPTLKIASWSKVPLSGIGPVIARRLAAPSWLMLPMTADGSDYDFSDDALARNAEGLHAHAVLPVEVNNYGLTFITWARPQGVSLAWAEKYFRGVYEVVWTDIAIS